MYYSELAGYNAARADFDNEYDNGVELLIRDIEVDDRMYHIVERKDALKPFIKLFESENEESNQLNAELSVAMLSIYKNINYKLKLFQKNVWKNHWPCMKN